MTTELAIIDIGSNSVRYAEEHEGRLPRKEVFTTRLGEGLFRFGRLGEEPMRRSIDLIRGLASRAESSGRAPFAYATSAVRDAANGREFASMVEAASGVPVRILSGAEEARFAFLAAAKKGETLIDIGGASMQLVTENEAVSFPAGAVRCGEIARSLSGAQNCGDIFPAQRAALRRYLEETVEFPEKPSALVGVGGTITTLAALLLGLREYSPSAVEGFCLKAEEARRLEALLEEAGDEKRRSHPLLARRHDIILYGAEILLFAMERLGADSLRVSEADGMEGYLAVLKGAYAEYNA